METMKNILSTWKQNMEIFDLVPAAVLTKEQLKPQFKKLAMSLHQDKTHSKDPEPMQMLNQANYYFKHDFDFNDVQTQFNHYMRDSFEQYFPFADHSIASYLSNQDAVGLLGEMFYVFGEMDHY